ncbi:MAG: BlaI/MecI/CopY family transcriptional regulator [Pseudomonadota bacterium]
MSKLITDAEFEVMDVLWRQSPLAASDVAAEVAPKTSWTLKTVKTLLSRLVDKGALTHEAEGRRYLYRPAISRKAYAKNETRSFAEKLFAGRAAPIVAHLADSRGLSEDDIQDLEKLIAELKRDAH